MNNSNLEIVELAYNVFDNYINDRERTLTRLEKEIAKLKLECAKIERRTEIMNQFAKQFFAEREKVRKLAMKSLDIAIAKGDSDISAIALAIISKEYSKDFLGMMNKITGLR